MGEVMPSRGSHYAIKLNGPGAKLNRVVIRWIRNGIQLNNGLASFENVEITDLPSKSQSGATDGGVGIEVNSTTPYISFTRITLHGTPTGLQPFAGFLVRKGSYINMQDCEIMKMGKALSIRAESGYVDKLAAVNTFFDNCDSYGVEIKTAGIYKVTAVQFANCWFSDCVHGLYIDGLADGTTANGCEFLGNSGEGVYVTGNSSQSKGIVLNANVIAENGTGIAITAPITGFTVTNNFIGAASGRAANVYGVYVAGLPANYYVISSNVIVYNLYGNLLDYGTGNVKLSGTAFNVVYP